MSTAPKPPIVPCPDCVRLGKWCSTGCREWDIYGPLVLGRDHVAGVGKVIKRG